MRINKYLILFVTALLIMSCAHRSGHNKRERKPRPSSISGDLVANKSTGGSKMDGAEIFKKYSNVNPKKYYSNKNNNP